MADQRHLLEKMGMHAPTKYIEVKILSMNIALFGYMLRVGTGETITDTEREHYSGHIIGDEPLTTEEQERIQYLIGKMQAEQRELVDYIAITEGRPFITVDGILDEFEGMVNLQETLEEETKRFREKKYPEDIPDESTPFERLIDRISKLIR